MIRIRGQNTGAAVRVQPVTSADAVCQGVQGCTILSEGREVVRVHTVVPPIRVIGSHIRGVRRDGHGTREIDLLPTRSALASKCGTGQQLSSATPQIAHMSRDVARALIKTNAGYEAVAVCLESDT